MFDGVDNSMTDKKKLKIKIFDKEYSLLVENEEIAKELAIYVNKVMEETKDDLFIEKNKNREFLIQATDKIKRIKLLLKEPELSDPS